MQAVYPGFQSENRQSPAGTQNLGYNKAMQYIIDGHNLIGQVRGLSLSDPEDEQTLVDLLIPFLRAKRSRAMVFFDRAAVGHSGQRNFGLVKAVFVPSGSTADTAIAEYIHQLGASARNHILISSDRMVQAAARSRHVEIMTSQKFAEKIEEFYTTEPQAAPSEIELSERELQEWEDLFTQYGGNPPDGLNP